jgi:hypothetical protein
MVLVATVALPLAACGGKLRLSARTMCEAHGGTYAPQTQQCSYTQQTLSAKQACEAQGGVYFSPEQYCEIEATK